MENIGKVLFMYLKMFSGNVDACATNEALYIEHKNRFYKLIPQLISKQEYDGAWDSITKENEVNK